ncbi:MAG: tRNA (adenosine(37)-N6)-threonylcarbamoyltransferase complex dimerization subunit type 1 TsaB [Proteobacteria bacterium]|nr:tRNA (adenosine(37)-N6)-threonylcarbamoyltransferase complex dimerization subunit type 1 TsaB [Pseudomonadota bacterium]
MRILALDTALNATQAAVYDAASGTVMAQESVPMERGHAEALVPMAGRVIEAAGLTFDQIDRFVVTTGPGSFTGLRIGISAARGFALVHGKPAVGVSTLTAFAAPLLFGQERFAVAAAIDARNGQVFFQAMALGAKPLVPPGVYPLEDAARKLGEGVFAYVGNAASRLARVRRDSGELPRAGVPAPVDSPAPDIAWVARLGAVADPAAAPARPYYLRDANVTLSDRNRLERA